MHRVSAVTAGSSTWVDSAPRGTPVDRRTVGVITTCTPRPSGPASPVAVVAGCTPPGMLRAAGRVPRAARREPGRRLAERGRRSRIVGGRWSMGRLVRGVVRIFGLFFVASMLFGIGSAVVAAFVKRRVETTEDPASNEPIAASDLCRRAVREQRTGAASGPGDHLVRRPRRGPPGRHARSIRRHARPAHDVRGHPDRRAGRLAGTVQRALDLRGHAGRHRRRAAARGRPPARAARHHAVRRRAGDDQPGWVLERRRPRGRGAAPGGHCGRSLDERARRPDERGQRGRPRTRVPAAGSLPA